MKRAEQLLGALTAGDVMRRAAVVLAEGTSVAAAARSLLKEQARSAPVTDSLGRCVGVLSAADILAWSAKVGSNGEDRDDAAACVWCDWQIVDVSLSRHDDLARHMTRDPFLVREDTRLAEVADVMLGFRRPVVVVDKERRPLGLVLSRDILAALASDDRRGSEEPLVAAAMGRPAPVRRLAQPSRR